MKTMTTTNPAALTAHALAVSILTGLSDAALIAETLTPGSLGYTMLTEDERAHADKLFINPLPLSVPEKRSRHSRNASVDAMRRTAKYIRACLIGGTLATAVRQAVA